MWLEKTPQSSLAPRPAANSISSCLTYFSPDFPCSHGRLLATSIIYFRAPTKMMPSLSRERLLFLSLALVHSASGDTQCYYPDGSKAVNYRYVPCTNDTFSACCNPNEYDICQPNGLCWWPGGSSLYRGACTDPTWQSPNCPKACRDGQLPCTLELFLPSKS
jgi:hypothetical protein